MASKRVESTEEPVVSFFNLELQLTAATVTSSQISGRCWSGVGNAAFCLEYLRLCKLTFLLKVSLRRIG